METPAYLSELLNHPSVTDICLNGNHSLHADFGKGLIPITVEEGIADPKAWLLTQLARMGKSWDARAPYLDGTLLPEAGSLFTHRLHAIFPPLSSHGILVTLRKLGMRGMTSDWPDDPFYRQLRNIVLRGENLVIAGATGSGKTRLMQELLGCVPPTERIIALEDTAELAPGHPHFMSLLSRTATADGCGEVSLKSLLKQTLRMRPDRIVLGECRGDEVLELLQAMNTGHRGLLCSLHANSPRDALRRIELLCLLSGKPLGISIIRELLALGIQWVAHVEKTRQGRRISALVRVEGREGDTIVLRPMTAEVSPVIA